ncbi:MAG TPA: SDR family oxidoreductase [Solirubrobacteraceae bacterium]|nr:SDR family oxidoreductase [Solirubrobacteraceae bacterium]
MLLENKTAVIYGAGGAIGGAVARAFAREGARLFLTGRDVAKLDALGVEAETAQVDALDETAVNEHLDAVGSVDISFNAIGPGANPQRLPLTELATDAFTGPIAFYTRSNFITATAAARRMSSQGSGAILTLTAVPGRMPARHIGGAAAAWGAVEAFTRSLALEVGPAGVRVVCLRAHAIPETPLIEENFATAAAAAGIAPAEFQALLEQTTLLKRLPTLAEVADTAAFLASDRAGAMTATVANVSAGFITD